MTYCSTEPATLVPTRELHVCIADSTLNDSQPSLTHLGLRDRYRRDHHLAPNKLRRLHRTAIRSDGVRGTCQTQEDHSIVYVPRCVLFCRRTARPLNNVNMAHL